MCIANYVASLIHASLCYIKFITLSSTEIISADLCYSLNFLCLNNFLLVLLHYRFPFARLCFTLGFQSVKRAEALPPRLLHSREGKEYRSYTSTRNFHWEICMHACTHILETRTLIVVYIHVVGSWAIRRGKRKWGGSGWIVSNPWDHILGLQSSCLGLYSGDTAYNILCNQKNI